MDHCSSEGATVGIQSYLSSRLNYSSKQFQNPKQFQFNFKSKYISISFQKSKPNVRNIELSYVWDRTISKILPHDLNSKMGNMIKEWIVFNKLEDFNSLLKYTDDDFTQTGKLCYINENGEKLHKKLIKEFFNLRWFIQHLIDENEYQYDDNEWTNPLSESNWTYQTNETFMKYVNFTLKEMTPEQIKQNPITVQHQKLNTEEGESNTNEQESTISNKRKKNILLPPV